jgi:flagellar biosynthesis GTPase FlhF
MFSPPSMSLANTAHLFLSATHAQHSMAPRALHHGAPSLRRCRRRHCFPRRQLQHWEELQSHYHKVRAATTQAKQSTKSIKATLDEQKARKESRERMLRDRRAMLRDGKITREEAQAFVALHREEVRCAPALARAHRPPLVLNANAVLFVQLCRVLEAVVHMQHGNTRLQDALKGLAGAILLQRCAAAAAAAG